MAKCNKQNNFCSNKITFDIQRGAINIYDDYLNMKEEIFNNQTGPSVTLTKVNPINFIVLISRNGVALTPIIDYNLVGQIVTFVDPLVNDNIRTVYF